MKLSTKTTYGLRALLRLVESCGTKPMSISAIAQAEDLSPAYLERIMGNLKSAKLVKSEKGMSGGYNLTADPQNISVLDVVRALEGWENIFHCTKKEEGNCSKSCSCQADLALLTVEEKLKNTLSGISLAELAQIKIK